MDQEYLHGGFLMKRERKTRWVIIKKKKEATLNKSFDFVAVKEGFFFVIRGARPPDAPDENRNFGHGLWVFLFVCIL